MGKSNEPYTIPELNQMVEHYRGTQENRVHSFRLKPHSDDEKKSTKTDWWDMPLTVCSCGSKKPPYIAESGRNCSALKTPHIVLENAYHSIVNASGLKIGSIPLGTKPISTVKAALCMSGQDSFEAGRCAEPHAANRVLNDADKVSKKSHTLAISDLLFSVALDARYPIAKPYCVTCRCVFPQLRNK